MEPTWVDRRIVLAIHDEQIAEHGGQPGLRDGGLLDSALARPRNRLAYAGAELPALAAEYAFGIIRDHPFLDGNKRTALVVSELFLALNGHELWPDDGVCVLVFLRVAAGEGRLTPDELDERLEAALSARTLGDLATLTADLMAAPSMPVAAMAQAEDVYRIDQRGGSVRRVGRWVVPRRLELRPQTADRDRSASAARPDRLALLRCSRDKQDAWLTVSVVSRS